MLARITSSLSRRIMVVNLFVRSAPAEASRNRPFQTAASPTSAPRPRRCGVGLAAVLSTASAGVS